MVGLCLFLISLLFSSAQTTSLQIPANIQALLDARQYSQAEQLIQAEIERTPTWDIGYLLLAQIQNMTGRYDLAERSALSAVRLRESLDGFMLLALAAQRQNKLNESIEWLEKAAQRRPDYSEIYKLLGVNYALGGMLQESEKALTRAVQLDPSNWELHYLLGRSLYELGELKRSQGALQDAAARNPSSSKPWTALGQVEEKLHDLKQAEKNYRKALELCEPQGTDCAWPLLQMGLLAERQKGPREAESFFRQAVNSRPDWAKPHFYLGKVLVALKELEDGRSEMETAIRLDGGKSEYHYQLAQLYRRINEIQKAEQHLLRYQALSSLERERKNTVNLSTQGDD
jgi:tetratricopeptide (TPR) repeat protein